MIILRTRIRYAILLTLIGVIAAVALVIRSDHLRFVRQPAIAHEASQSVAGSAALRAELDPETGRPKIGGGRSELVLDPDTREGLRRDNEGLVEVHHPNGAVSVHLQGRYQHASVARIGKDGKAFTCIEDTSAVNWMLKKVPRASSSARNAEVK